MEIVRCISCDGYGWFEDEFTGEVEECDWCAGVGYVYRAADGTDRKIPLEDLRIESVSQQLEALEAKRMREMGYQGQARKPWEQAIRRGTQGGINPYDEPEDGEDS